MKRGLKAKGTLPYHAVHLITESYNRYPDEKGTESHLMGQAWLQ